MNKILIVEDDPFQAKMAEVLFSQHSDATIVLAENGKVALESLEQGELPELVVCDLAMPAMDGLEFLRRLSLSHPQIMVAILSSAEAAVLSSVKEMAQSYGFSRVETLKKPLSQSGVERFLQRARQYWARSARPLNSPPLPTRDTLLEAIQQHQLVLAYQPHVEAATGKVKGAEALIRWQHPSLGLLGPQFFLEPLLNEGLGYQLTSLVLQQALAACRRWHDKGMKLSISVNVTPSDLVEPNFCEAVFKALENSGVDSQYLTLEVTENEIYPNFGRVLETLNRLRIHNVNLSIDDFGTGYSSMLQLISAPFAELKIDQLFIRNMLSQDKHRVAVEASLSLAKHMEMDSVAEGVETAVHVKQLTELGCKYLQGYYYSKPLLEDDFAEWLANNT
ncbi:EAL domain-containing response regulator [Aliagarivorans marinus]|uniref:EAL domain-containing response regulator n=1 Tax=Aliagarivorans marinus TaxID=561965 RepID=UPI0004208082|nr:EAL domain-containing response regulator [Aliagarivorans marinus]